MAPARANSLLPQVSEPVVLIPAIRKDSTTGYKNVTYSRSRKKFTNRLETRREHQLVARDPTAHTYWAGFLGIVGLALPSTLMTSCGL